MTRTRIGARGSRLSLWQANWVKTRIEQSVPDAEVEIVVIATQGDMVQDLSIFAKGDKGVFTVEIERALLEGRIDLAVHSAKDLPTVLPEGLVISAFSERENPLDALVSASGRGLDALPSGARIGSSSLRRQALLLHHRPDLRVEPLRGNLDTRLRKLDEGQCEALVLAQAGLARLGWGDRVTEILPPELMLPAVGQGALALETREEDVVTRATVAFLDDLPTRRSLEAERALLHALEAGCRAPVAGWGRAFGDRLLLEGLVASPDGRLVVRDSLEGDPAFAAELGLKLADRLLSQGAAAILRPLLAPRKDR